MYHRILVPLDGSATAERGLREAIALAPVHQARLHLLHVFDAYPMLVDMAAAASFDQLHRDMLKAGEDILARAKADAAAAGVEADTVLLDTVRGRAAASIVEEARSAGCDLIVMGTHGRRGLSHLLLGSDAEMVLRSATVPVLLLRQPEP